MKKKILFVTSTRADFGKLKSLIKITKKRKDFKVYIVVTGMHMIGKFGNTYREVLKVFVYLINLKIYVNSYMVMIGKNH